MSSQPEMFPMTEEERIALLRSNLASDVEKRLAKRDTAAVALADAQEAEDLARGLLAVFDHMVRERASQHGKSVMQGAADIINSGALDTDDCTVTASVTPAVDPITGEVEASEDDLFRSAVELVRSTTAASASLLQRRLSIGYAQAGQLLDRMEAEGVILPAAPGSKARKVVAAHELPAVAP
jgi:DNA segregation ATPase FtsK/SpoIIIE-like protein